MHSTLYHILMAHAKHLKEKIMNLYYLPFSRMSHGKWGLIIVIKSWGSIIYSRLKAMLSYRDETCLSVLEALDIYNTPSFN